MRLIYLLEKALDVLILNVSLMFITFLHFFIDKKCYQATAITMFLVFIVQLLLKLVDHRMIFQLE